MGYATLAFANCILRNTQECLEQSEKSIRTQPRDAFTRWLHGVNLILTGKPRKAIPHLEEALRLDPIAARTPYLNLLGMAHLHLDQYETSLEILNRNLARDGPTGPHMEVYRAMALLELGRNDEARTLIQEIVRSAPEFAADVWLSRWLHPDSYGKWMSRLYEIGLPRKADVLPQVLQ